jgi:transposase
MSEQPNKRRADEETTVLHLKTFAHGTPVPPKEQPAEGATELIRKAAVETVAETAKPVIVPKAAGPLSPDEMLGAVAYCYIKGVFSSADIERKMLRDPEFREALDGVVPDPATIRKFRRMNRDAIQTLLEKFYGRLRQQQKYVREAFPASQSPPAAATLDARPRPDENTAIFVRREASERLDKATFIDGMSDF